MTTSPVYTAISHLPRTGLPIEIQQALSTALTGFAWTKSEKHDLANAVLSLGATADDPTVPDPCPARCPCWFGGACEYTDVPDYLAGGVR